MENTLERSSGKRLTLYSCDKALESLGAVRREFSLEPRYDIAPGQFLGAVSDEGQGRVWGGFRWGIAPVIWSGDEARAHRRLFSARAETLGQKLTFAQALRFRRVLVPVDGMWVYGRVEGAPRPFLLRSTDGAPLFLAAIWEENQGEKQLALVSVEANRLLEPFGARMPAILRGDDVGVWLDPNITHPRPLLKALKTVPVRGLLITPTRAVGGRSGLFEDDDARTALCEIYGPFFQSEKPCFAPKKRLVLRDHEVGGHICFRTKSFSRDDATRWHPVVDIECGHVFCDCPDFRYRHAHHEPDIWTPHWWCKHVRRAVDNCRRHGDLPIQPSSPVSM